MYWPTVINGVLSFLAASGLTFVVLHPKIHEGGLIKFGLIMMIVSLFATGAVLFTDMSREAAFNAGITLRLGLIVVCLGYAVRFRRRSKNGEPTDFGSLTER